MIDERQQHQFINVDKLKKSKSHLLPHLLCGILKQRNKALLSKICQSITIEEIVQLLHLTTNNHNEYMSTKGGIFIKLTKQYILNKDPMQYVNIFQKKYKTLYPKTIRTYKIDQQ